jgi:hypothetical protein
MVQINDRVLTVATQRGQNLLNEEVVALIERYHPHERPGVSRETLEAYATALANEPQYHFDVEEFLEAVDEQVIDVETWAGEGMLYRVDDRLSAYPARWHAELGGSTDVRKYLRFLREEAPGFTHDAAGAGQGIPEETLLDIVATVGRTDRKEAKNALTQLRQRGELVEGPDQHPDAGVQLAENANNLRDESIDS